MNPILPSIGVEIIPQPGVVMIAGNCQDEIGFSVFVEKIPLLLELIFLQMNSQDKTATAKHLYSSRTLHVSLIDRISMTTILHQLRVVSSFFTVEAV